jgi:hypothetical protein
MAMSELKAISGHEIREDIDYNTRGIDPENKEWCNYGKELCDTLYYRKFEADEVIADLEESHKKEVEQLLIEIVKLKKEIESMKVKFRKFNDNVCKKIVDASRTMQTISQDAQMDFYEEFIKDAK